LVIQIINMVKKLTKEDLYKIDRRFNDVSQALNAYSLDELKLIYNNTKMSNTDSEALLNVVTTKLKVNI
jgi:hypothetical protein